MTLEAAIQAVADCPCADHQQAFLGALRLTDELIFEIGDSNVPITEGAFTTGPGDDVRLATSTPAAAGGLEFLLGFPDLEAARRHQPGGLFAGMPPADAFRMVLGGVLDGILIAAVTPDDAWAVAQRPDLEHLLAG